MPKLPTCDIAPDPQTISCNWTASEPEPSRKKDKEQQKLEDFASIRIEAASSSPSRRPNSAKDLREKGFLRDVVEALRNKVAKKTNKTSKVEHFAVRTKQ